MRTTEELGGAGVAPAPRPANLVRRLVAITTRPTVILPALNLVLFFAVWEYVGRQIDPILFSPPSRVIRVFGELIISGELLRATLVTVGTLAVGYGLSVAVGIPVGVLLGRQAVLGRVVNPYLDAIYATPRVVIVPLMILWFGVGFTGRLFLIFLGTVIPIIVSTAVGVRDARPDLIEVAQSFGALGFHVVRHVQLPAAVPFVASGLRIGAERAVVGVVVGEIFLELTGLGGLIQLNAVRFNTAEVLCSVVVIAVIGIVFIGLLDALERRVSPWREAT